VVAEPDPAVSLWNATWEAADVQVLTAGWEARSALLFAVRWNELWFRRADTTARWRSAAYPRQDASGIVALTTTITAERGLGQRFPGQPDPDATGGHGPLRSLGSGREAAAAGGRVVAIAFPWLIS
jgi:hypothetical protein